jgi:hypothetical protein
MQLRYADAVDNAQYKTALPTAARAQRKADGGE